LKRKQSRSKSARRDRREPYETHEPSTGDSAPRRARTGAAPSHDRTRATRSSRPHRSQLTAWILPLILVLAFVLRLVYVLQSRASPYFAEPQMDAAYHVDWARALAS